MTCSVKSTLALPPAEIAADVLAALTSVAEQSFFGFFSPADAADWTELAQPVSTDWVHVSVVFQGSFSGRLETQLPATLGTELLGAFLGRSPDEAVDPHEVEDMCGEFANMVCGLWLSRRFPTVVFGLGAPEVSIANAPRTTWRASEARALGTLNDHPVAVWVTVEN